MGEQPGTRLCAIGTTGLKLLLSHMGTNCKVETLLYKCSRECWGNYSGNCWGDGASARFPCMSPGPSLTRKVLVFVLYQLVIVLAAVLSGDPQRAKLSLQPCAFF